VKRSHLQPCRAGISIIEVMFAIGIAIIGLLGVVALLPLAASNVSRGVTMDRMARLGENALNTIHVRGYTSPAMWLAYFPADGTLGPTRPAAYYPFLDPGSAAGSPPWQTDFEGNPGWLYDQAVGRYAFSPLPLEGFCIDPRFVAVRGGFETSGTPAASVPAYNARAFPYYHGSRAFYGGDSVWIPRMRRLTVFDQAGVGRGVIEALQADEIFTSRDDLNFNLPTDRALPAEQAFAWTAGPDNRPGVAGNDDDGLNGVDDPGELGFPGSDDVGRRSAQGNFSWIATIAPKLDGNLEFHDLYTLSIVVFNQRAANLPLDIFQERLAQVVFPYGNNLDIQLRTIYPPGWSASSLTPQSRPESDLELQTGDWIMLCSYAGTRTPTVPYPTPAERFLPAFQWYRVTATDSEASFDTANGQWFRHTTIDGPGWLPAFQQRQNSYLSTTTNPTHAVLVSGVIGVFERTIRLESSSLWRN